MVPSLLRHPATRPKSLQSIPVALKPRITSNWASVPASRAAAWRHECVFFVKRPRHAPLSPPCHAARETRARQGRQGRAGKGLPALPALRANQQLTSDNLIAIYWRDARTTPVLSSCRLAVFSPRRQRNHAPATRLHRAIFAQPYDVGTDALDDQTHLKARQARRDFMRRKRGRGRKRVGGGLAVF